MLQITRLIVVFITLGLSACGGGEPSVPQAQASQDNSTVLGKHTIHFNALSTNEVPAEVAKAMGIVRSKSRAMLNVSVVNTESNQAVEADVEVRAANLSGQLKQVSMRKLAQGDAIYYIGEISVSHLETLIFDIDVVPEGETQAAQVRIKRQYYTD